MTITPEDIAMVTHQVNKAYCEAIGDNSQVEWRDAPDWQKDSARNAVSLHLGKDVGPEASHENWMALKEGKGWKYGTIKNPDKKEHHCMVPFGQLPREQQAKDFILRGVVHALRPYIIY